jgi:hypothetical protein
MPIVQAELYSGVSAYPSGRLLVAVLARALLSSGGTIDIRTVEKMLALFIGDFL